MRLNDVMDYLREKGSESTVKIFRKHGATCDMFGVKVADLKIITKKVKTNHELACQLFDTLNSDAQYLAGLIADPNAFSKKDFEDWISKSNWYMISEYAIAWNVAESPNCIEFCKEWLNSTDETTQEVAWASMSAYLGITDDSILNIEFHRGLIKKVSQEIHSSANRVKYCMNGYLIALGCAVPELTLECKAAGKSLGKIDVFMGETACKIPDVVTYIEKVEAKNKIGNKKKRAKC